MDSCDDVYLHEYRFSDWMPSPIKSLAVDPFSGGVAVGRDDGDIEILNPNGRWYNQARVCGRSNFQLTGLVFSQIEEESGRLFGASMHGYIFEVDCSTLSIGNIRDSYGGAIWNICANPRVALVGVGCEDGSAKIFSYADSRLEYVRSMQPTGSRVLCLSFDPSQPRLFVGCADGTIRCFNETSGVSLFRLTGDATKGLPTAIWSLHVTKDSTVVSGDNRGQLQFWNGSSGDELLCTLHQHTAPILAICSSQEGDRVFASGVDSRVICVNRLHRHAHHEERTGALVGDGTYDPAQWKWVYASAQRPHSHDVQTLAIVPAGKDSEQGRLMSGPMLISGSEDCKLCVYSVNDFVGTRPAWVLPVAARGLVSMDESCSLAAVKHRDHVDIWSLSRKAVTALTTSSQDQVKHTGNSTDMASLGPRLQLMTGADRDHIHSAVVSPDGNVVAVSGGGADGGSKVATGGLRLWHLQSVDDGIKAVRVALSEEVVRLTSGDAGECQAIAFSRDGRCLAVTVAGGGQVDILLLEVTGGGDDQDTASLRHKLNHTRSLRSATNGSVGSGSGDSSLYSQLSGAVDSMSFSADGRWLVVSSCSHLVSVYEVDRVAMHWVLPQFSSAVSCVSFHPTSANSLLVALSGDNSFFIYDVIEKGLSPWSRDNSDSVPQWSESLNRSSVGPIYNVSFDPSSVSSFVLYGQAYSVCVDLDEKIPSSTTNTAASVSQDKVCVPVPLDSSWAELASSQEQLSHGFPVNRRDRKKRKQRELEAASTTTSGLLTSSGSSKQSRAKRPSRNYKVIKMRSVVQLSMIGRQEMVVIENPWVRILENLPDTLARKRYAT